MADVKARVEDRRLELGLTQRSVASALGITQPHYSKVVGGVAALTAEMDAAMEAWLAPGAGGGPAPAAPALPIGRAKRLARSIERQLRQLSHLLEADGTAAVRRPVTRTGVRTDR